MSIAHLTKAIVLKDDFTEARLLRAEALIKMQQYKELPKISTLYSPKIPMKKLHYCSAVK